MQCANIEATQLEMGTNEANDCELRELSDLQLAVVGGGGGEVAFV
jgi:hypothetical protein